MLRYIRKIICLLVFGLTLSACFDHPEVYRESVEVCFSPVVAPISRSEQAVYPVTQSFGVWAYSLPSGSSWNKSYSQAELFMNGETVAFTGQDWRCEKEYLWEPQQELSFFTWSPSGLNANFTPEQGICFTDFDVQTLQELPMFSHPILDVSQPNQGAPVTVLFTHALAHVEFRVSTTLNTDRQVYVTGIRIPGVAHVGDFHSLPEPRWITGEQRMDIEFCPSAVAVGHVSESVGEGIWVLPQWVNQPVEVTFDIYDQDGQPVLLEQTTQSEFMNTEWKVGRMYVYTLELNSESVIFNTEILENL